MTAYLKWLVPLTVLYIMLTGNPEPLNWGFGVLVALLLVVLIRPNPTPFNWSRLPHAIGAAILFTLHLLRDLVISGLEVARLVIQREPDIQQGIIAIPDATDIDWVTTASAEAITLTPGEMVVEIGKDGTLYTHTLNVEKSLASSLAAQQLRAHELEEIRA